MNEPVRAIVMGHGDLAAGLVSAVAQVTGLGAAFLALSNRSLSRDQLEETLRGALDRTGATVVFTDLPAGSGTIAARRVQRDRPALVIASGVNLAMLLEFAMRDGHPPAEAAAAASEKGRAAILFTGAGGTGGH